MAASTLARFVQEVGIAGGIWWIGHLATSQVMAALTQSFAQMPH